jgi:hypothetical protein
MPVELIWSLLRHRHAVNCGALAALIVASWAYLWLGAGIEMEMRDVGRTHVGDAARMEPAVCSDDLWTKTET